MKSSQIRLKTESSSLPRSYPHVFPKEDPTSEIRFAHVHPVHILPRPGRTEQHWRAPRQSLLFYGRGPGWLRADRCCALLLRLSNTGGPSVTAALSLFLLPACRRLYQLTGLIHSYQPPGWGRGRTWTAQPCGGVQGAPLPPPPPPMASRRSFLSLQVDFNTDWESSYFPLQALALHVYSRCAAIVFLVLQLACFLSRQNGAGWGGELLLRRKPKSPKLGVSVTGSDVVGRRELKYFGFTCNTRTPCSPGVVAYEINILRRFSSTI